MAARESQNSFTGEGLACRRGERRVFKDVAFALTPGDALLLGGPNGSGKTSLLRLMAGLATPEQGVIAWDGAAIADDPAAHRARLHYIGHQEAVKLALTAGERRRLGLARLVASPAMLWLLDEPTTSLDAEAIEILLTAIAGHRRAGGCVALATHAPLPLPGAHTLSLAAHATGGQG